MSQLPFDFVEVIMPAAICNTGSIKVLPIVSIIPKHPCDFVKVTINAVDDEGDYIIYIYLVLRVIKYIFDENCIDFRRPRFTDMWSI